MGGKARDRHFELFRPHTGFKHLVLQHYIEAWTRKLLLRRGAGDEVLLLDAFAGVGMDETGQHGSPIILARIAAEAEGQLKRLAADRDCRVRLVAIEKDAANYARLKTNLAPFGDRAIAHRGTLADYLPALLERNPGVPMMAFLDPCGVDGLDASLVNQILALERNEVLARFSDEGALRHFGVISADQIQSSDAVQEDLLLWEHGEPAISEKGQRSAQRVRAATQVTAARARQILDTAFGGNHWQAEVEHFPSGARRRQRFVELYRELLAKTGARYTTVIPIWDATCQLDANLVHASWSPYGRSTMKNAVETALKRCGLPPKAKDLIRLDLGVKLEDVMQSAQEAFAGQTVRWAEQAKLPSVRRTVLQETDVFPGQLAQLQRKMREAGWLAPKRGKQPLQVRFPAKIDPAS